MSPKIEEKIVEAIKKVYDPEIPVNIYELGLIYKSSFLSSLSSSKIFFHSSIVRQASSI